MKILYTITTGDLVVVNPSPTTKRQYEVNEDGNRVELDAIHICSEADEVTITQGEVGKILRLVGLDTETPSLSWVDREDPIPLEVTNYQIKRALNKTPGDRAAVEALVSSSDNQDLIDGWTSASVFKNNDPILLGAIAYLGWSQEKVNDLLKLAATFE